MQEETLSGYLPVVPAIVTELDEQLKTMLKEHGCTIETDGERHIVSYPPGTIKQQVFPRIREYQYRLLLPNGFELREIEDTDAITYLYGVIK